MKEFKYRSDILTWSIENVRNVPSEMGVYVLRNNPSMEGIIYVGSTNDLKRRLEEHFLSEDISEVLFFDYYKTYSIEEARKIEELWIVKYKPKYNDRTG